MLQKVPLHIASTEANLKEAIRNSAAPTIASTQLMSAGSNSSSRKRKLPMNTEQHSPSLSVTKRRRIRIDPGSTAQEQLPSPMPSLDCLLTLGGLPSANHHPPAMDAPRSGTRSASRSSNTAPILNPGQRSSMQPPTPKMVPSTPSRIHSVVLSDVLAQPTSSLSHNKPSASDTSAPSNFARPVPRTQSVTPAPPNRPGHSKDTFKAPNLFYIHTPLRTGSKQANDWSARSSAPGQSSIGFSAVRDWLKPFFCPALIVPPFFSLTQRRGKRFIPITDEDDDDEDDEIVDD